MLERIRRRAGDELLHGNELRNTQVHAGRAVFGNRAHHVALGEHADRRVAFGADDILDDQRADIAGTHQLGCNSDGLVHADRCDTGGFLAQDISDLHGNLLGVNYCVKSGIHNANCQHGKDAWSRTRCEQK